MERPRLCSHSGLMAGIAVVALLLSLQPAWGQVKTPQGQKTLPSGIRCLLKAYPDFFCGAESNTLVGCDGKRWTYDTGTTHKTHADLLNFPDLNDQMVMAYKSGRHYSTPIPVNFDPGRVRHEPFLRAMYGDSREAVRAQLVPVTWLPTTVGKTLMVTTVNCVHHKLKAVSEEIEALPANIRQVVEKTSGTFVWRTIKDTNRL